MLSLHTSLSRPSGVPRLGLRWVGPFSLEGTLELFLVLANCENRDCRHSCASAGVKVPSHSWRESDAAVPWAVGVADPLERRPHSRPGHVSPESSAPVSALGVAGFILTIWAATGTALGADDVERPPSASFRLCILGRTHIVCLFLTAASFSVLSVLSAGHNPFYL